ncbi:unnamed protein product [Soboliphyme baturini]|uniref:Nuclear receptor domain-containing protein n=1 Tax=Soboliphyme baturini TaxID=241478 RepID=A0A183J1C6_9BILA|nr:unnamed protein product [Soboliphyme baturini]
MNDWLSRTCRIRFVDFGSPGPVFLSGTKGRGSSCLKSDCPVMTVRRRNAVRNSAARKRVRIGRRWCAAGGARLVCNYSNDCDCRRCHLKSGDRGDWVTTTTSNDRDRCYCRRGRGSFQFSATAPPANSVATLNG